MTSAELDAINDHAQVEWDNYTALNTLDGGTLPITDAITSWSVVRYENGSLFGKELAKNLSASTKTLIDYTATKGKTYKYAIIPTTANSSYYVSTNDATVDYFDWILIDTVTYASFNLQLNVESGTLQQNTSTSEYIGFTKYPAISESSVNYMSGSIRCLFGNMINNSLVDNTDLYDSFCEFITSGHLKLLKDRKGSCWKVYTRNLSSQYMDAIAQQIRTINFDFIEVEAV
jgi:hypothetical protein